MHCRELVELAAVVAVHSSAFAKSASGGNYLSQSGLEQYWSASKLRLEHWTGSLKEYLQTQTVGETAQTRAWHAVRPVVEEVLVTEVLTRVWTAVASACDRTDDSPSISPIVRSIYHGHLEARNRALNVLVYGKGFSAAEAVEVNRLRRRCERWCDLLLAYVANDGAGDEFAFEPARRRDFARDAREESHPLAWQMVLTSLRATFGQELCAIAHSSDLNQQVATAILACFEGDLFDSTGHMHSLWLERMEHRASDTEEMIDELLAIDEVVRRPLSRVR